MRALHDVISFGRGVGDVLPAMAVLLLFGAIFSVLAARSLRVN